MNAKNFVKLTIRAISELYFIVYPYIAFLEAINANDKITLLGATLTFIYVVLAINIFEWAWGDKK